MDDDRIGDWCQTFTGRKLAGGFPDPGVPEMTKRKIKVYVAGPYTKPDPCANTKAAIDAADALWALGFVPFIPHLTHFWHTMSPKPYGDWLEYDNEWLPCCDAVLRLPGLSSGADAEIELAKSLGIPVFAFIGDLQTHFYNLERHGQA